jgi:hypothetical protein
VWHVRRTHQNVTGFRLDLLIAHREERPARTNNEDFVVAVEVQKWTGANLVS